jgi:D-hexose-6-phosphate mutarotase
LCVSANNDLFGSWKWLGTVTDNDQETTVSFGLTPENARQDLLKHWPNAFELVYNVTLTDSTLKTTLKAKNTGATAYEITPLFHTYFHVQVFTLIPSGCVDPN